MSINGQTGRKRHLGAETVLAPFLAILHRTASFDVVNGEGGMILVFVFFARGVLVAGNMAHTSFWFHVTPRTRRALCRLRS